MAKVGRVGDADQALAVPAEPVTRLGPTGFDPSRIDPKIISALFLAIRAADKADAKCPARRKHLGGALCPRCHAASNESCRPFSYANNVVAGAARDFAQAIEAQRAATTKIGAVEDESALAKPCAQGTPQ